MSGARKYNSVLYIKFVATVSSLNQFSMLVLYRKINSDISEFVGYVTYLAIAEHANLILGDFNEDSLLNERPITTSLQSLGFTQIVSERTHTWVPALIIFIPETTKTASQILICSYLIVLIFLTIIQLFYTIKIGWQLSLLVLKHGQIDKLLFLIFYCIYKQIKTKLYFIFYRDHGFFLTKKGSS